MKTISLYRLNGMPGNKQVEELSDSMKAGIVKILRKRNYREHVDRIYWTAWYAQTTRSIDVRDKHCLANLYIVRGEVNEVVFCDLTDGTIDEQMLSLNVDTSNSNLEESAKGSEEATLNYSNRRTKTIMTIDNETGQVTGYDIQDKQTDEVLLRKSFLNYPNSSAYGKIVVENKELGYFGPDVV